jgi:hypothetical protein
MLDRYTQAASAVVFWARYMANETGSSVIDTDHYSDSVTEDFTRRNADLPNDVIETKARLKLIRSRLENSIGEHDFELARACSDEEGAEREKLLTLYHHYGLLDWIFD